MPLSISSLSCSVAAASLILLAAPAAAQEWSEPFPGVRYLQRSAPGPLQIDVLEIDLCAGGISMRATTEAERGQTVPDWAPSAGVELAVNGDFFDREINVPRGAARGNGETWGIADGAVRGFVAFGLDRVEISPEKEVVDPLPEWPRHVIGFLPQLLRGGEVIENGTGLCTTQHPRTALGLSRDRQTMYLMVVDGRSDISVGATCAQTAELLRELGAWDAINLDGGGSSTMWIQGMGVRNVPTDAAGPRVVANHLGVHAGGDGAPGSCMPYAPYEDALAAGRFATTSSDIDGDGRADACARGPDGFECARSGAGGFEAVAPGPPLSDALSWDDPTNYRTIAMGDVTGDGRADLCARGNAGWRCWPSTGAAFGDDFQLDAMSDEAGWDAPERYGTIRLGDIDGDGDDDVCGRAAEGLRCWPSLGDGFGPPTDPIAALADGAGWDAPSRWSTVRLGDVTGDGLADVCARTADGMACWRSTGTGFDPTAIAGPGWSDAAGWTEASHYSTVQLVDIDGDGRADLCGRAATGLDCHLSTGDGFGPAVALAALDDEHGWDDPPNYRSIALADIDGDGDRDVCARADAGIVCWPFEGDAFGARIDGPALADDDGWWRARYTRTFRFADIDGDGDADLCARAFDGLHCWPVAGGVFGERIDGPAWSRELGWWDPSHHGTIRIASEPPFTAGPGSGDAGPGDPADPSMSTGCGCRTTSTAPTGALLILAALGLATRRRRKPERSVGEQ